MLSSYKFPTNDIKVYRYVYNSTIDFIRIEGPVRYSLFFRWLNSTYSILNYDEMDFLIDLFQGKNFNALEQESGELVVRDVDNYAFSAVQDGDRKEAVFKLEEIVEILIEIRFRLQDVHLEKGEFIPVESKPDDEDEYGYIKYRYKVDYSK